MQIGVLTVLLGDQSLEDAVEYLDDEDAQAELLGLLDEYDMGLSALATHSNPIHPGPLKE